MRSKREFKRKPTTHIGDNKTVNRLAINWIVAGCLSAASAQARIGQAVTECKQHYGEPSQSGQVDKWERPLTVTHEDSIPFKTLNGSSPKSRSSESGAQGTDSKSDLSDLNEEELTEAAQIDAQSYYASHTRINKDNTDTDAIGIAHAIRHHLLGNQAFTYEVSFFETLDALIADKD